MSRINSVNHLHMQKANTTRSAASPHFGLQLPKSAFDADLGSDKEDPKALGEQGGDLYFGFVTLLFLPDVDEGVGGEADPL